MDVIRVMYCIDSVYMDCGGGMWKDRVEGLDRAWGVYSVYRVLQGFHVA